MLKTSSSLPSLRLIHIRQTGRDLYLFDSMAVDHGPRLMDMYENNNQSRPYFNDCHSSHVATYGYVRSELEREHPSSIYLLDTFESLAQWAFGPDGPPLLEAIAYGDFAHDGRANVDNLILCPGPKDFRLIPRDGREWKDLVERYRNVLEACPTRPLLMWYDGDMWEEGQHWMQGYSA